MLHIILHANFSVVQSFAYSLQDQAAAEVSKWISTRHYAIANWHADRILTVAEKAMVNISQKAPRSSPSSHSESRSLPFGPPHVPYAIYYASLIVWVGLVQQRDLAPSLVRSPILRGERMLRLHKTQIANLLAGVLGEVN